MRDDVQPFGDGAVRISLGPGMRAAEVLRALRALAGVIDAVVGERHAVVTFEPGCPPAGLTEAVGRARAATATGERVREHRISVVYDGEDLGLVASRVGLSPEDVARLHSEALYEVVVVGFLPGFAYLRGLDSRLLVPRRATPRIRVPAGSVAVAGPYTGVYPLASPGGWSLVGRAIGFTAFDAASGSALAVGDRVRFAPVRP